MSFTNFHCVSCLETVSVLVQGKTQIYNIIRSFKEREHTTITDWIWFVCIHYLEGHLYRWSPLSPPNFIHISLGGITPSCHVSWPNLLIHVVCFITCTAGIYLFFFSSWWNTTLAKSVTQARGEGRISWLQCRVRKEKGIDSAVTFTASKSFFILSLCFFSLLILILHAFIHLKAISVSI